MHSKVRVAVVGGGVIGLTSAIRLKEAGYAVDVLARDFTPNNTSDVAAAFWCPYRVSEDERAFAWAQRTFDVFAELQPIAAAGIEMRRQREVFKHPAENPWYYKITRGFARCMNDQLPPGFIDGFEFDTYLIDTPTYMKYLNDRCADSGISLKQTEVPRLESLREDYDLAVNCTGVWARKFVGDTKVYPIRGQVIVTHLPEDFSRTITTWDAGEYPAYIVPRLKTCILGGTTLAENWDLTPDPETAIGIRQRCSTLNPEVAKLEALDDRVGLRPGRKRVRLERDDSLPDLPVVHCYGHGGSGFTLSWGCAEEVVQLLS
ncbi:MAG: FAD-dependent oxidoreductase [Verrucomicrobiae bacterium]|nr:FAD-dependent oxidoreductase [Verrucomicrobiae bacterium]